jgi:hypothetical protein
VSTARKPAIAGEETSGEITTRVGPETEKVPKVVLFLISETNKGPSKLQKKRLKRDIQILIFEGLKSKTFQKEMGKVRGGEAAPTGGKVEGKTPAWDKIASQCIKFLRERHPQELSELSSKALKKTPGKVVQSKVEKVTEEWRMKEEFEERKKVDAIKVFLRWCELYNQAWVSSEWILLKRLFHPSCFPSFLLPYLILNLGLLA